MGEFLGYDESEGFKSMLDQHWTEVDEEFKVSIFEYIKGDGEKNRVILQYGDNFYVYEFWQYEIEDEDEEYPAVLLERAVDVGMDDGVLDSSLITETDYFKFASPEDIDGFITFLKYVAENEKYTSDYMSKYIHDSGNFDAETRIIRVTLDDNTYFEYQYNRGARALTFEGGGYILTPVQSSKLLLLLGYMIVFHDIDIGVRFDNKRYFAEYDKFDGATAENVGEFLGYVENIDDFEEFVYNQTYLEFYGEISEASIYRYVSENDDGVERIIIPFGDAFYIYAFYSYVNE
jgi:hypothetical protein